MKLIELKGLTKVYCLEKLKVPVLHGIDLEIMQGEFVAIMGASGSGKSTILNILGLLDKPSSGSYKLAGVEISKYSDNELAALRNRYLGFVFQQFNLLPKLTVLENVALPSVYSESEDKRFHEDPLKLLSMVGLAERVNHRPSEISGGQQQRVSIARALVNKPLLIFADEPTGNLDTKSSLEVVKILKELNSTGITVMMVTHEQEIAAFASRIIKIKDGLIVSHEGMVREYNKDINRSAEKFKSKRISLSKVKGYLVQAVKSIFDNRMRSILSILGVTIGVASLISMLAIGAGTKKSVEKEVSNLGSNLLMVGPGARKKQSVNGMAAAVLRLESKDVDDLIKTVEGVQDACGYSVGQVQVVGAGNNCNTNLLGVSSSYAYLRNSEPPIGRFFTELEAKNMEKVALIGKTVIKEIFRDTKFDPTGMYIKINRVNFKVIGVLPEKGSNEQQDEDDKVVVPLDTALRRVLGRKCLDYVDVKVAKDADMKRVSEGIIERLSYTHRIPSSVENAIKVINMMDIQKAMSEMTRTFSLFLVAIAFLSLLVGGIGIMNIMFVSVSERTKEIGLRKAIGASNVDILFQFTIESIFVCCLGGGIGIAFGYGLSAVISKLAGWNTVVTPFSIILAFSFSGLIGLIFGVWPARKASLLDPIEALRHD